MPDGLTLRQAKFTQEYLRHGNATKAAKVAGYAPTSAHVRGSELVRNRKVRKHIEKLTKRYEINSERVLLRLDNLSSKAEEQGLYAVSVKAEELLGRALGLFVDRSLNVNANIDLNSQHIEAIRQLAARGARRSQKNERPGDDALDVSADVSTAGDNAICHKIGYTTTDPDNREKSVINQRTTSDVLTPSTLKQSADDGSDVDGNHI